jgi:hypothetical protein
MNQTMGAAGGGLAGPLSENAQKRRERLESYFHRFREEYPMYAESVRKFPHATPKYPENLRKVNLSKKRMAQVKIPEPVKSVICGTCLGDSSLRINPKYANARIQNRHSSHQYSWFFWKWLVCCREYTNGINSMTFQNPDGYSVPRAFKERASRDPVILDHGAGPDCVLPRDLRFPRARSARAAREPGAGRHPGSSTGRVSSKRGGKPNPEFPTGTRGASPAPRALRARGRGSATPSTLRNTYSDP